MYKPLFLLAALTLLPAQEQERRDPAGLGYAGIDYGLIQSPRSELLVLNKTDSTLSFVDPANSTILAVIGTGIGPHEIAVEAGGARAVVSNYGVSRPGSSLTVVDLAKRIPIETIDLGEHRRPHGLAFRSAGHVLVTCEESHALLEVDLDARKVVRAIKTDQEVAHMVVTSPDGGRAFVTNIGSGTLSVFDLEAGLLLKSIKTGAGSEGIAITPDGGEVWVTSRGADRLTIVDAKTLEERAQIPCASTPIRVQITPDGLRALVSDYKSGDVAVFDVKARKELARLSLAATPAEQKLEGSTAPVGIVIDPSGKRAFISNTQANVVSVLDLERLVLSGRLHAGREPDGLGWVSRP